MLNFINKDGKKMMEMNDKGEVVIFDTALTGAGQIKELVKGEKEDGEDNE